MVILMMIAGGILGSSWAAKKGASVLVGATLLTNRNEIAVKKAIIEQDLGLERSKFEAAMEASARKKQIEETGEEDLPGDPLWSMLELPLNEFEDLPDVVGVYLLRRDESHLLLKEIYRRRVINETGPAGERFTHLLLKYNVREKGKVKAFIGYEPVVNIAWLQEVSRRRFEAGLDKKLGLSKESA